MSQKLNGTESQEVIMDEQLPEGYLETKLEQVMILKFGERMNQWMKTHKPNEKFPITFTGLSEPVWQNREERRKNKKARMR